MKMKEERISELDDKQIKIIHSTEQREKIENKNWAEPTHLQENNRRCTICSIRGLSSVHLSHSVVANSLGPHGLQQARFCCPSPTPVVYSNLCSLSWWCHPTISSSVIPFSSHLQSSQHQGLLKSQFFTSGGQTIGASTLHCIFRCNAVVDFIEYSII